MTTDKSLIKMIGITKRFPGVVANSDVDFDLRAGEIHSLLGENGAGKTTLMNILSGMYQPDSGTIVVRDQKVQIRSPRDSRQLGIGMVYQHFTLIPNLTVIENLILGFEGGFYLNLQSAAQKLQHVTETYGLPVDPLSKIQDLSVGERQKIEILKILFHESNVLILDEPTSMLNPSETQSLFHAMRLLRDTGKAVVLITHKVSEALALSDRITIMRSGKVAAELPREALLAQGLKRATDRILDCMFATIPKVEQTLAEKELDDAKVLELKEVAVLKSQGTLGLQRVSFYIRKGEILGIAGVNTEVQRMLAEVIGGQKRVSAGRLLYRGQDITAMDTAQRFDLGISYITDDRINEGCVLSMTLTDNSILQAYYQDPFSRFGILNLSNVRAFTGNLIEKFNIQATGCEAQIGSLSGGNIQKFILARSLSANPDLIVCNNPTHGLDAKSVRFTQELLRQESRRGTAVLLISSDIDELLNCSDRIGILFKGEISGILDRRDATAVKVGKLMVGFRS
jgi:simple sugar transport system ATP-binding protein